MKVKDLVIVANLGEMKVYVANPRDLEAEAGLKEDHIKLDLLNDVDFIEAHKHLKDLVTDMAGRFKADAGKMGASIAEENHLNQEIERELIKVLADEIVKMVNSAMPPRYFLALPEPIFNRVMDIVLKDNTAKERLFRFVKEDLVKTDKTKLPKIFQEKGEHF